MVTPHIEGPYRARNKMNVTTRKYDVSPVARPENSAATYLAGGIASLAAAVSLNPDGDVPGHTITILEE